MLVGDFKYWSENNADEYAYGWTFEEEKMVQMTSPEGEPMMIPESNVEKAIARGFK